MRRLKMVLACAIVVVGLARASTESQGIPEDRGAIDAVLAESVAALNKHDPVGASSHYMPDAEFTNVAGIQVVGAAEIQKFLAVGFEGRLKAATWKPVNHTIRFIRPDVAIVHSTAEISGFMNADGSTEQPHREFSIRVFQKDGGVSRVAAFHNTTVAATLKRE